MYLFKFVKALIQETRIRVNSQLSHFVKLTPFKEDTVSKMLAWGMVCLPKQQKQRSPAFLDTLYDCHEHECDTGSTSSHVLTIQP